MVNTNTQHEINHLASLAMKTKFTEAESKTKMAANRLASAVGIFLIRGVSVGTLKAARDEYLSAGSEESQALLNWSKSLKD